MRLIFAIPHYCSVVAKAGRHGSTDGNVTERVRALTGCLAAIQQHFGRPQCVVDHARRTTTPANKSTTDLADVIVCTSGQSHILDQIRLGAGYFTHQPSTVDPKLLGFECHAILRDRVGAYDFYCYMEDDLLIRDPWFFIKLRWFAAQFGNEALLMPNRFEVTCNRIVHKAYVDGPMRPQVTAGFQDVSAVPVLEADVMGFRMSFVRTFNPHCGGFFLNARQMETWVAKPYFLDRDVRFISPLESAASLGVMRTFRVYKPAAEAGSFLEVEHAAARYVRNIRVPGSGPASE